MSWKFKKNYADEKNCKIFGTKYFKKKINSLAYTCKGCIHVKINKCSIRNKYVKYWNLLFAKLLDFCLYVLNQPENEWNALI